MQAVGGNVLPIFGILFKRKQAKSRLAKTGKHSHLRRRRQRASGVYLIEFLVALVVSTTIAQILIDSISQTHRFSNDGQCQLLAATIAEEVIDFARGSSYPELQNLMVASPHTLPINTGDSSIDPVFPRMLVMDLQNLGWSQPALANRFRGTVTESAAYSAAYPGMIQLTVTVSWTQSGGMKHQYKLSTLVSKYGIHG